MSRLVEDPSLHGRHAGVSAWWYRVPQKLRYLVVGGFNTAFGFLVFAALELTLGEELPYLGVLLVSHVISVLVAYGLHRVLVFRADGHVLRDLLRFWLVYAVVLGVNVLALPFLVEVLRMPVVPAQALFTFVTVVASYVAHHRFSFRRPRVVPEA